MVSKSDDEEKTMVLSLQQTHFADGDYGGLTMLLFWLEMIRVEAPSS
jgi:hypothetical protein